MMDMLHIGRRSVAIRRCYENRLRAYLLRFLEDLLVQEDLLHALSEFAFLGKSCLRDFRGSRHVRLQELWLPLRHGDDPEEPAEALKGLQRQARDLLMAPQRLENQNSYVYWFRAVAAVLCCCCSCCCWSGLLRLLLLSFFLDRGTALKIMEDLPTLSQPSFSSFSDSKSSRS